MKKNILVLLFAHVTVICLSQTVDNTTPSIEKNYLQKSKNQKIAAWILLGGGIGVSVIGLTQINVAGSDNGSVNNTPGTVLLATGLAASLTSIPFFISSQKNKKRALALSIKTEKMLQLTKNNYAYMPVSSLTLKIKL